MRYRRSSFITNPTLGFVRSDVLQVGVHRRVPFLSGPLCFSGTHRDVLIEIWLKMFGHLVSICSVRKITGKTECSNNSQTKEI